MNYDKNQIINHSIFLLRRIEYLSTCFGVENVKTCVVISLDFWIKKQEIGHNVKLCGSAIIVKFRVWISCFRLVRNKLSLYISCFRLVNNKLSLYVSCFSLVNHKLSLYISCFRLVNNKLSLYIVPSSGNSGKSSSNRSYKINQTYC